MTRELQEGKLWFLFLAAVMGGFLFGHDMAVFPPMTAKLPTWSVFALFGTLVVFRLFRAIFIARETKGRALEEIKL